MAAVRSLGLHEPSAISYLITESILPANPPRSSYEWTYQNASEGHLPVVDEVLSTSSCAVWSRNGIIKRVFNLDIEAEPILHAFTTTFVSTAGPTTNPGDINQQSDVKEAALVVILRTQAHIFLLSGDTHVLPLSFEVQYALPCVSGFVIQRKVVKELERAHSDAQSIGNCVSSLLGAPRDGVRQASRPSIILPEPYQPITNSNPKAARLPRTYSFTKLLSEFGLIVSGVTRTLESLETCQALPPDEHIIYISTDSELQDSASSRPGLVHIAVTINPTKSCLTLWQVLYVQSELESQRPKVFNKPADSKRRKSSNVYGRQTGAATPIVRGPGTFRESFSGLAQSLAENVPFQLDRVDIPRKTDDLALQLGPEFEHGGVQTRSARRVSSMLARTDLGGGSDRNAFNDLALGTASRKSLSRSIRHGESLGGLGDRQSFGRRRSSFQGTSSILSDGTSFLDIPASHLLDDGHLPHGANPPGEEARQESVSNLPRDMAFVKLKSVPHEHLKVSVPIEPDFKVTTMLAPDRSTVDDRQSRTLSVCIMDRSACEMIIINVVVRSPTASFKSRSKPFSYDLKAIEIRQGRAIVDACKIVDGTIQRLAVLTKTREGQNLVHLEAPWSASYRLDLPQQYRLFDDMSRGYVDIMDSVRESGTHRTIRASDVEVTMFHGSENQHEILLVDRQGRHHRLQLHLQPSVLLIRKVLDLANFVLPPNQHDSLLVAWWEVKRWLVAQGEDTNVEWTSLTITVFLLAVPFVGSIQNKPNGGQKRRKGAALRSSNNEAADLEHWNQMTELEDTTALSSSWLWATTDHDSRSEPKRVSRHAKSVSNEFESEAKDTFLLRCAGLARDFLQSPAGESATGPEGYLPTAVNKERTLRRTALASMLIGLHLLREDEKLDQTLSSSGSQSNVDLATLITQLALWLNWDGWQAAPGKYYGYEVARLSHRVFELSRIETLEIPKQPFDPPSIFHHIEHCMRSNRHIEFPSLLDLISQSHNTTVNHPLWKEATRLTPHLFALTAFFSHYKSDKMSSTIVGDMVKTAIDSKTLNLVPDGIAAVWRQAIVSTRGCAPSSWPPKARALLDRNDANIGQTIEGVKQGSLHWGYTHESARDYRAISNMATEADAFSRWDTSSEVDRQVVTRLIFSDDRRFQEASKLVNQTRPPVVECASEPGWSESDLLDAQKELAQHVTKRTLSVATGRGMMHFDGRTPLLTERVPMPAFSLQCVMKAPNNSDSLQPMTFSADKSIFTEDKTCWAFFHNGASAGLMISKHSQWIDTSWILYNKPPELTNRHAGFLLALGLNGHLKSLAKWVAFKYLTPKHTMISVGLLLGLAASYLGTMDSLVTRLLSVHVTRLLPQGAAELNLSPLTQTTGLIGIGLLYHKSQHRRMSEVMLSEMENNDYEERSGEEPILRDEGYRLAAGFSLGLINIGQGGKLHSLHDMGVVERLLTIAVGTKNVNHVHVLDRATAGAVISVTFIFMKTNDVAIARKIDIPDTLLQFEYVRPDIFLLRTLARHLIMWDEITPTQDFIRNSLPRSYQARSELHTTKRLRTDDLPFFNILAGICFAMSLRFAGSRKHDVRDLLVTYLDQFLRLSRLPALNYDSKVTLNGIRNCLDVLALSCATVMAGSGDLTVMRRLRALHGRTDKDTPFGSHLAAHMALGALFLSGGTATFGTSDLAIASLVIAFYPVFPLDVLDNRGHLQALRHLWVLAVDNRCLVARDVNTGHVVSGIEAHVELTDGTKLKIQSPGLLPELDSIRKIGFDHENYWSLDFDLSDKFKDTNFTIREKFTKDGKGINVSLQRRLAHEKPNDDTFMTELRAFGEARGVPSSNSDLAAKEKWSSDSSRKQNPFNWVFGLDSFSQIDHDEKALVLDSVRFPNMTSSESSKVLHSTSVDTRLEFETGTLGPDTESSDGRHDQDISSPDPNSRKTLPRRNLDRDKLWQIRLLLAWADRLEEAEEEKLAQGQEPADEQPTWIKREVIERLRWRIWKMTDGHEPQQS